MSYFNTKENCMHYSGKIWISGKIGERGNICADIGGTELMVLEYRPKITDENIVSAIKTIGWNPDEWL